MSAPVVGGRDGSESLLSSGVPLVVRWSISFRFGSDLFRATYDLQLDSLAFQFNRSDLEVNLCEEWMLAARDLYDPTRLLTPIVEM